MSIFSERKMAMKSVPPAVAPAIRQMIMARALNSPPNTLTNNMSVVTA